MAYVESYVVAVPTDKKEIHVSVFQAVCHAIDGRFNAIRHILWYHGKKGAGVQTEGRMQCSPLLKRPTNIQFAKAYLPVP